MSVAKTDVENDIESSSSDRNNRRLCKSRKEKMVDGVLGGIAEYFGVDPTLVRIAYLVLLVIYNPVGFIILYVLLAIVMPECEEIEEGELISKKEGRISLQENRAAVLVLLAIGIFLIVKGTVPSHLVPDSFVGVFLITLALYLLLRKENGK